MGLSQNDPACDFLSAYNSYVTEIETPKLYMELKLWFIIPSKNLAWFWFFKKEVIRYLILRSWPFLTIPFIPSKLNCILLFMKLFRNAFDCQTSYSQEVSFRVESLAKYAAVIIKIDFYWFLPANVYSLQFRS